MVADSPYGLLTFILLTLILGRLGRLGDRTGDGADLAAHRCSALYGVPDRGVRFLHYALYGEPLLSLHYFIIAFSGC